MIEFRLRTEEDTPKREVAVDKPRFVRWNEGMDRLNLSVMRAVVLEQQGITVRPERIAAVLGNMAAHRERVVSGRPGETEVSFDVGPSHRATLVTMSNLAILELMDPALKEIHPRLMSGLIDSHAEPFSVAQGIEVWRQDLAALENGRIVVPSVNPV